MKKPLPIGTQIRSARHAAGLSQVALAEALGVQQGVISFWERGRSPDTATLVRIAAALSCSLLIDGSGARLVDPASVG